MNIKILFLFYITICNPLVSSAVIKIENLDPILRFNKFALLYAAKNCVTFIQLHVDFFRTSTRTNEECCLILGNNNQKSINLDIL